MNKYLLAIETCMPKDKTLTTFVRIKYVSHSLSQSVVLSRKTVKYLLGGIEVSYTLVHSYNILVITRILSLALDL